MEDRHYPEAPAECWEDIQQELYHKYNRGTEEFLQDL